MYHTSRHLQLPRNDDGQTLLIKRVNKDLVSVISGKNDGQYPKWYDASNFSATRSVQSLARSSVLLIISEDVES